MSRRQSFRDEIVDRLKDLIDSRGLSVAALEKELGRGRGYVGDAFRGEKRLSLEMVLEVLKVLGVEPESLFGRSPRHEPGDATRALGESEVAEGTTRPHPGRPHFPQLEESTLLVQALVHLLDEKGLISTSELWNAWRELQRRPSGR